MKTKLIKTLALLIALAGLAGCEEHVDYTEEPMNFDVNQDLQAAIQQNRMPQLAVRLGCTACHSVDHKLIGPAWKEVGRRYRDATTFEYQGKSYPLVEGLVQKVSHGGSGNWGMEQMPVMDPTGAKHGQIEKLVGFILELGKRQP